MTPYRLISFIPAMLLLLGCEETSYDPIEVRCLAFGPSEEIPNLHTCYGGGISPPLSFSEMPDETVSIAVIIEDADRLLGPYTHLLLWGLPPKTTVPENLEVNLPEGASLGVADDESTVGYLPPCPPPGDPHRFVFKAYALDRAVTLEKGSTRESLDKQMKGHILGYGELVGIVTPK